MFCCSWHWFENVRFWPAQLAQTGDDVLSHVNVHGELQLPPETKVQAANTKKEINSSQTTPNNSNQNENCDVLTVRIIAVVLTELTLIHKSGVLAGAVCTHWVVSVVTVVAAR